MYEELRICQFPAGTPEIDPGEYYLLWCDDDILAGIQHTSFRLDGDGEFVGLASASGEFLDSVWFGPQAVDAAYGRSPDGGPAWASLVPTPGAPNQTLRRTESTPYPDEFVLAVYPNPFNARVQIRFEAVALTAYKAEIFDLTGRLIWSRYLNESQPGSYQVQWGGHTFAGQPAGSGLYLLRVGGSNRFATSKLLLIR